jgi:hypothetical protein
MHAREPTAQNLHQPEAELAGELADCRLLLIDEIRARFSVLAVEKSVASGPDASADPVSSLDDPHRGASLVEVVAGGEPGQTSAGDQDRAAAK